jgi:peptidoglycan-associated lipoprotein
MKKLSMLKAVLVVLICVAGLVGCASTQPAATPQAQAPQQVTPTDMDQQGQAATADQGRLQQEVVPSHDAIAAMERIYFDFDQFTLDAEARRVLGNNAKYLQAHGATKVVIEGHCDERGSDEYNLALGESRALAAKNYLISLGVSASRLSVISYGEEKPLVKGANEAAWAQNRRAEFKAVR